MATIFNFPSFAFLSDRRIIPYHMTIIVDNICKCVARSVDCLKYMGTLEDDVSWIVRFALVRRMCNQLERKESIQFLTMYLGTLTEDVRHANSVYIYAIRFMLAKEYDNVLEREMEYHYILDCEEKSRPRCLPAKILATVLLAKLKCDQCYSERELQCCRLFEDVKTYLGEAKRRFEGIKTAGEKEIEEAMLLEAFIVLWEINCDCLPSMQVGDERVQYWFMNALPIAASSADWMLFSLYVECRILKALSEDNWANGKSVPQIQTCCLKFENALNIFSNIAYKQWIFDEKQLMAVLDMIDTVAHSMKKCDNLFEDEQVLGMYKKALNFTRTFLGPGSWWISYFARLISSMYKKMGKTAEQLQYSELSSKLN